MAKEWSIKDEAYLYDNMDRESDYKMGRHLNRTEAAVRAKRARMGLLRAAEEPNAGPLEPRVNDGFGSIENDMIADYVEMGGNLTQKELARKYGISRQQVSAFLRERGITKVSLPFAPSTIEGTDEEVLVERALNEKEARVAAKIEQAYPARIEMEYRKLMAERLSQDRLVKVAKELGPVLSKVKPVVEFMGERITGQTVHIPTADEHLGLLVWDEESFGENYDTDIAADRLIAHAEAAAEYSVGARVIYRSFVGDLFHALLGGTEHGTKLDQDTRAGKVWRRSLEALKYSIELLATAAPVEVYGVRGNHDGQFEFLAAMHILEEAFADDPDVNIHITYGRYAAFRVNKSLHVLDHGYGLNRLNDSAKLRSLTVARQFGELDAEFVYTYIGHMHYRETVADDNIEIIRLPALAETDDYSTSLRFRNQPSASFYTLGADGRIMEERRYYA